MKTKDIILWLFNPSDTHLQFLFKKAQISLYDCVDYFSSSDQAANEKIKKLQRKLIKQTDIMVVNSKTLLQIHKQLRSDIEIVPQGFDAVAFGTKTNTPKKILKKKTTKPVIGFVGAINYRLDYKLLYKLIKNNPHWDFVLWGPIKENEQDKIFNTSNQIAQLKTLPNVIWGESTSRNHIYSLIKEFDIGIIPYDIRQKFNKYCYPMKLFEYFYVGIPVLSTPIVELEKFKPLVAIAETSQKWETQINQLLKRPWSKKYQEKQRRLAMDQSWDKKIKMISSLIKKVSKERL